MYFTPTAASWLNMVERFFRDLTVNRLRRGVFIGLPELVGAIGACTERFRSQGLSTWQPLRRLHHC